MRFERLKTGLATAAGALLVTVACSGSKPAAPTQSAAAPAALDRTVLPIPEPDYPHETELDARKATPPPRFEVKAPEGAPNVLIVLVDDMGFGMPSAFGGPIHMPTADRLAQAGLRYNQFHTTAVCSPTRTALLSGRNHHMNNMGGITETATAFPGNTGQRPNNVAPLAEMLRLNGYSTGFFGKNHETAPWEVSPSGPTDRWPTRSGFDEFYGFFGGETNQWAPYLYHGMNPVEIPRDPNYHFMTDMTDKAIAWMQFQKALTPDKPFFMYFAPGATHAPHHVPKEWIAKYKGKFDSGWDAMREKTLARQIEIGVVPAGTKLAAKPEAIKDWDALSADEKKLFARQMEVYAGFGEYADTEIGRLVDAIGETGQLDNTLVFYILGDNGTSAEGGMNGMFSEMTYFNGVQETVADMLKKYDEWGGPTTYPHMAAGWAVAGDAPFMWTKQVASNFGGTRNGMVVHWPKRVKAKGEVRSQFHHVIDVAPTVLEAANLPEPKSVNGTVQEPIHGVSMMYTFDDAKAESRHKVQYFEIFANRAIYADGWFAGTVHKAPWEAKPRGALLDDKWELYDTRTDFSLATDLAAQNPAKLKEMQDLFMKEAVKYRVLPIDDRSRRARQREAGRTAGPDGGPDVADASRRHEGHVGERVPQRQEPLPDDHRRRGEPGGRRQRRDHRAGRALRRLEPVHEGRQADLRLQLHRPPALHGGVAAGGPGWQVDDPPRVRLRRGRPGQGWTGDDLRERQEGRRGTDRAHAADDLLGRRDRGRGRGRRDTGDGGLQGLRQQVHRQDPQGHGRSGGDGGRRAGRGGQSRRRSREEGRRRELRHTQQRT